MTARVRTALAREWALAGQDVARLWAFLRRALRAAKTLARDGRVPRWLRVLFVIGCVQIPVLPFDEIALGLAVVILFAFYRAMLAEAWSESREESER